MSRIAYFVPEWDDHVDPAYDFARDTHSGGTGDWSSEVYAHQLYPAPICDGVLVSRVVAEKTRKKARRVQELGMRGYLRLPRGVPLLGDCGAFGYVNESVPRYTTPDILDYYTRLGFDCGVSIDHIILPSTKDKQERYDLTIANAEAFLEEHRARGLAWTPIGAIQGWDVRTYAAAARAYARMGYDYVAVGGVARSPTGRILQVARAVRDALGPGVRLHLFGVARPAGLRAMQALGVTSVDSAGPLRSAWLGAERNYVLPDGSSYAALRIPQVGKSFRAKRMPERCDGGLVRLEQEALTRVRALARHECGVEDALSALLCFDACWPGPRQDMSLLYRRTLAERPWERCPCAVCVACGVEVLIFRGSNRNRRRGFHNTYVFHGLLQRILAGEDVGLSDVWEPAEEPSLFA